MRTRRLTTAVATLAIVLGLQIVATPSAMAENAPTCKEQSVRNTVPSTQVKAQAQPVVLVHGWNGRSEQMFKLGDNLAKKLKIQSNVVITPLYFDYQAANYHWAANPEIAACMADYLHQVSDAHKAVGGDGKVLIVAHSMGGLAVRFATDRRYTAHPADDVLAGVVTLDTPSLGSPFGNQLVARSAEVVLGHHVQPVWPFPRAGTDGSICLAVHTVSTSLPDGCDKAPYLPASVPLTQVAGNVSISRSIFGIHLYDIDLGSDGIVGSGSSQGYLESGRVSQHAQTGSQVVARLERCTVGLDQVQGVAIAQGLLQAGAKGAFANFAATVGTSVFSDNAAMDQILSGKQGTQALQLMLAANFTAPCSHTGIVSDSDALADTAEAISGYIQRLKQPDPKAVFAPFVGDWQVHGSGLTVKSDLTGEMTVAGAKCSPASDPACLGHIGLQFQVNGSSITAKVTQADFTDNTGGLFMGNSGVLKPGASKGVIQLVLDGSAGGNSNFCKTDASDLC